MKVIGGKPRPVETWEIGCALFAAATAGLAPILIPLGIGRSHGAQHVGLVVAAMPLGLLTSPLWGSLADRTRAHRLLFAIGTLLSGGALSLFGLTRSLSIWIGLGFAVGLGMAACNTIAILFVVEGHPRAEWNERLSWQQFLVGCGMVAGSLGASVLHRREVHVGFFAAAILSILAGAIVLLTVPKTGLRPAARPEGGALERTLTNLRRLGRSRFALLLLVWVLGNIGLTAVYSLFPLLMRDLFGVSPSASSVAYAIALGVALVLYAPAGVWSEKYGGGRVLQGGMALRLAAAIALVLAVDAGTSRVAIAVAAFAVMTAFYPLMTVAGSIRASELAPIEEGAAMGLFNSALAATQTLGAALGGAAAARWGYESVVWLCAVGLAVGLVLSPPLRRRRAHGAAAAIPEVEV